MDEKLKGQIKIIRFKSKVLENNPLKDPHERDLLVYLPEKYSGHSRGYPTIFFCCLLLEIIIIPPLTIIHFL